MRFKKGFTLAEILIVLMVIGALATMTIPSLMKGVDEARYKTAYKKAYNAIVNLCAMEKISGNLPADKSTDSVKAMFNLLRTNLSVKDYAEFTSNDPSSSAVLGSGDFYANIAGATSMFTSGTSTDASSGTITYAAGDNSPWITTEDNMAYAVMAGTNNNCGTKTQINGLPDPKAGENSACLIIVVDVNGLTQGPNKMETQTIGANEAIELTGDRYQIYIGTDGAAAGSKKTTVTGRIVADLK